MKKNNKLILCIDLDEWYHCRWATGSPIARWENVQSCFQDYYGSNKPKGEIIKPTQKILVMLKRAKVKATFFVLGEVAEWYPGLIRQIAKEGHEIACHGMHHQDLTMIDQKTFLTQLIHNRQILRKLSGQEVLGFRAPNLVLTPWLHKVLISQKFLYDSSVCPSRSLQGKYKNQITAPLNPYRISKKTLLQTGNLNFWEIPIPVFPILKLPGAVSIATRIFGFYWTIITLEAALRKGSASYYLHPYELNQAPKLGKMRFKERIFLRNIGQPMEEILAKLLKRYRGRIIMAKDYVLNKENND